MRRPNSKFKIRNSKLGPRTSEQSAAEGNKVVRISDPEIVKRTFEFAVRNAKLCMFLGNKPGASRTLGNQLLRSGTSIGANVEESQSAANTADFVNKLTIALKEARETCYWLRLLSAADVVDKKRLAPLTQEASEIAKILGAIIVSKKRNEQAV